MLLMALAAVQANLEIQGAAIAPSAKPSGFHIKDATFSAPIIVRSRVELQTHSRSLKKVNEKTVTWFEVQIFMYTGTDDDTDPGRWIECFRANIQTQYVSSATGVDGGLENRLITKSAQDDFEAAKSICTRRISRDSFYAYHKAHGLVYGPRFQLIDDVQWDGAYTSTASVGDVAQDCPFGTFIHPATLDAAFQTCMTAVWSEALSKNAPTMVPHRMFDVFVSTMPWDRTIESPLHIMTSSPDREHRGTACRVRILRDDGELLCDVKQLDISAVAGGDAGSTTAEKKIIYGIGWQPLLDMMEPGQVSAMCEKHVPAHQSSLSQNDMVDFYTQLENALFTIIDDTLSNLGSEAIALMPPHLQYYVSWMELQLQRHRSEGRATNGAARPTITEAIWEDLVALKPSWKLFVTVARNLDAILRSEVDPLSYMFSTGEAEDFYADVCSHICAKLEPFFTLTAHQNPKQRILEVGAGTGGMTANILRMFQAQEELTGAPAFAKYTYTDISSAFFEAAQARFENFVSSGRMEFQTFDLDQDSATQGYDGGQYDMIIAGSVIHATSSIAATLRNLRRLLKPGGKLVLLEITAPDKIVGSFVFGTLPGWWRGEEARLASSPAVNEDAWNQFLKDTGFAGNELVVQDWNDERCHDFSLIVTTAKALDESAPNRHHRIVTVTSGTDFQQSLAEQLLSVMKEHPSCDDTVMPINGASSIDIASDDLVVFLLDTEQAFMDNVDEASFGRIKDLLSRTKKLLWVTATDPASESYAADHVSLGLLRSLRSEDVGKQIVSLIIEDLNTPDTMTMEISKVLQASFRQQSRELEYVLRDGVLCVPRLSYSQPLDKAVRSALEPVIRSETWGMGPSVKLSVGVPGNLESLRFSDDPETSTTLGPCQVEIEAKAWGLSFRDIFLALGRLNEADGFGFECAGQVVRVGDECKSLTPGDRVCMTARGSMRRYPRGDEREVHQIPQDMSFESAASMIGPALTAVYSLVEVARLRRGEKILIHSAAGATGQLAVMLALSIGAEVYCTVGNEEKKLHMINSFGIPGERILYSRDTSFAQGIARLTDGYGVDVLLNSLAGDKLLAGWGCMAPYGRFIEMGKSDIMANEALPMTGFQRNVTFAAIDFYHTTEHRKDITQEMLAKAMLLARGQVFRAPQPMHVFGASQVEEAFRYLQSGQHAGRIVIVPQDTDVVPKLLIEKPKWSFASNASYLVVGGYGGLGRAVMPWMARKGAKHIIVLSRSGATTAAAKDVVAQLESEGVRVCTIRCDASSRANVAAALKEADNCMPPVKGCINAAMLLQDTLFPKMSQQQWLGTVDAKLKSSTILSELLPGDLDFFVLFSSLSGVYGTPGQSNYAGGCTSQDALARGRVIRGLKATSIDIGWMRTIGVVAESTLYQRVREREADMQQIEEDEFLALLDICCDPHRAIGHADDSQILLGPVTPADIRNQGEEPPPILSRPLFMGFDDLQSRELALAQNQPSHVTPAARFRRADTDEERIDVVVETLVAKIARALAVAVPDIDTSKPLFEYGVDSLVALELRNWLVKEFESDIAVFDMMGGISIAGIGGLVVERGESKSRDVHG
jgi:NADPH:quinone reductase-like Zn-dependent oxidoreductase/SAM-dependent methyltransferase